MRQLSYRAAIREAHAQLLASDERVFVIGQGLWNPWYAGGSLDSLEREFGKRRLLDCPVSEAAATGLAVGAAIAGMRPIAFHPRMDFLILACDTMVNQAANWEALFGTPVPLVVRAAVNRGGEQGPQHSQSLQAWFMHVPGWKVVMPATPADAKGLLIAAAEDPSPVLYVDDRWLYDEMGEVPESMDATPLGLASRRYDGNDVTIVASSWMAAESLRAARMLAREGIRVDVIDLRTVKPWDRETVFESVKRTGRAVIADGGWRTGGVSAEIAAEVSEACFEWLEAPVRRVALPDAPTPANRVAEMSYYPDADTIADSARELARPKARRAAA